MVDINHRQQVLSQLMQPSQKEKTMGRDHNAGQTDASNNEHNPPVSHVEELFTWSADGCREISERRSDYKDGLDHHKRQTGK